jgi:hypothetical protein
MWASDHGSLHRSLFSSNLRRTAAALRASLCLALAAALIAAGTPGAARAELVATASATAVEGADAAAQARAELAAILARDEARAELARLGVTPEDAQARVAALSDAEVLAVQQRLAELPAGSGFLEVVASILVLTVLIFVITDLLGFTDVFSFIRPLPKGTAKDPQPFASATARRP